MNFPFYIARRYLLSKKSHNIINIISFISAVGVGVVSMALIVILSVFNGFEDIVTGMFNSFNPDIEIKVNKGKTFSDSIINEKKLKYINGIESITSVVEENALLEYNGQQHIVTIKGVSPEISHTSGLDTLIIDGNFLLEEGGKDYAVVGQGVAYYLNIRLSDFFKPINVFVPKRGKGVSLDPEKAFNREAIFPSGVFSAQQDYDSRYVIVPLRFAKSLMDYSDELTALEIKIKKDADIEQVKKELNGVLGEKYSVKDRFQQQELLYKIMKTEKWAVFLILTLILIVATTSIIGSLTMLIIDKKKDLSVLMSMGASLKNIRRVFAFEGLMIIVAGALGGLLLGALICWLQMQFGLVKLNAEGSFIISSYPVKMKIIDFVMSGFAVLVIGAIATWLPVSRINSQSQNQNL